MNESIIWLSGTGWRANSYVAGNILVDAAVSADAVYPYREQIDTIVLTHGHFDHTANLLELAELCSAEVMIGEYDLPFLSDPRISLSHQFGQRPTAYPAKILKDGDTVGGFRVYHTPGHTRGSISLFRESDGALIAGDTIFPEGSFGRFDLPTGSRADLVGSISKLAELPVNSLWPGHDMPVVTDAKRHVLLSKQFLERYG
ncbi:MAG: MBL fold metallo-hydrolase [Methanocorpusculum sp.]|jgi:hydroxyacylglutathione hydrolase|uniref:MBL fold metallo-hydrolase n=1 Tax=Methanocorpusculum sp. TaxID=2058474 RepID=UPI0016BA4567|nr:MBL fold metallo-hydrolase [Methanocorpusculum sp.]MDD4423004.1 MBL fold metallo-hydrolase [Methanocorpusculum parvum]MDD2248386.1 MBL fold metallo-hydrolase [Methanocorpusculum sp.]MDD2802974.1 MBL fold metallo-hydrolase [Methanocorpusculum sp.]MDD3046895.1 MBL fold metallo-hydrolase [Methanocorpusculum sp.]MDD3912237.1 MBL fold metallo-hydrolase [Methanocorpusculum sp.]